MTLIIPEKKTLEVNLMEAVGLAWTLRDTFQIRFENRTGTKMVDKDTATVKFVSVEIQENQIETGAIEILKEIRPEWNSADIDFKLLTDGITNKLVKCYLKDNTQDVVLVRVYGNKTDMLIDRKAETSNIILLHQENLAPELYATFKNGLAYEYVPGVTLTPQTVTNPKIYNLIARKMAKLHLVKPKNHETRKPAVWEKIEQFYNLIPERFSDSEKQKEFEKLDYIYPKTRFLDEINLLKSELNKLECPMVFAHNDLLLGNVIYDSNKNCVTFIDYEYADMNYQPFDIGNHFAEFQGIDITANGHSCYPDKELQKQWIAAYLKEFLNKTEVTDGEVDDLYVKTNKFALASHMLWGLWAFVQAEHSTISFNYMEYGHMRLNQYFNSKPEVLAL